MPPKKKSDKKKKGSVEPPKDVPDLEWIDIPHIASTSNLIYNQKIRIRIKALFDVLDVDKTQHLNAENAALLIRAVGLFPTDVEMEVWLPMIGRRLNEGRALCRKSVVL